MLFFFVFFLPNLIFLSVSVAAALQSSLIYLIFLSVSVVAAFHSLLFIN